MRAGAEIDLGYDSGELGSAGSPVRNSAGNGVDDDVLPVRIFLGGGGIGNAEYVAGALDQCVLEASEGPQKGPVVDARKLNSLEHAIEALVRTSRRGPKTVERIEMREATRFEQRRRDRKSVV